MKFEIQPQISLIDEPVSIRITGAPASSEITLTAGTVDALGNHWASQAVFRVDSEGVVDPAKQAPVSEDYSDRDPLSNKWVKKKLHVPLMRNHYDG